MLRFENLKVTNGPYLRVYFVKHPGPGESVDLGALKGNIGNQNYTIPAGTDVAPFGSVVIWCWTFGVLFEIAPLTPASS